MDIDAGLARQLIASAVLIGATTLIHSVFVASAAALLRGARSPGSGVLRGVRDVCVLFFLALWLMSAHLLSIALWGAAFLRLTLFEALEPAIYFAAVSYTTLGFGDLLLEEQWRLLSGACAAAGLLMFGLSAAFLFEATGKLDLVKDD